MDASIVKEVESAFTIGDYVKGMELYLKCDVESLLEDMSISRVRLEGGGGVCI